MESLCAQCARLSIVRQNAATRRIYQTVRSFSAVQSYASDENKGDSLAARSGRSMADALKDGNRTSSPPRRPVIRKYTPSTDHRGDTEGGSSKGNTRTQVPSSPSIPIRRVGQVLQRAPLQDRTPVLHRTQPPGGPLLRRTGESQAGRSGIRPGRQDTRDGRNAPDRRGQPRQGGALRGKGRGPPKPDRRRRLAPKQDEDDAELDEIEKTIAEQLEKNIDPSPNPTTFMPYDPEKLSLDKLRADWPNTLLSTTGMTESIIQKIEWLSRRLPHGYQSPEQIAEHYLKGNLTRFESDAERETVLKLASDLSAKTKSDAEAGLLHKHETPRFQIVDDPTFTSLAAKSTEKSFLVDMGVKGEYDVVKEPEYPILQNAARILNNNETYGPLQAQKLLKRIEALMPQARGAEGKVKKQAKRA